MATVGVKGLKLKNPDNSVINWQTLLTMTRQCQTETGEVIDYQSSVTVVQWPV